MPKLVLNQSKQKLVQDMEVCIISRENIKPSSSTPSHLRTHELSLMDQICSGASLLIILFYKGPIKAASHHLKLSLSETLLHYYPFAGRFKDHFTINCDDYGATFIETQVAGDIFEAPKQPDNGKLVQLLPQVQQLVSNQMNLAVQLNHFDCGGVAFSFRIRHVVADATAAAYFIKNWATIASGGNPLKDVIFDCTHIFPPQDLSGLLTLEEVKRTGLDQSSAFIKRSFVFEGPNIAAPREKIGNAKTRFEAVCAVLWSTVIAANRKTGENFVATIPVDLRKRMNPRIPEHCIGNIIAVATAKCKGEETTDYNILAGKLGESIRKASEDGKYCLLNATEEEGREDQMVLVVGVDFHFMKQISSGEILQGGRVNNIAILVDTCDGEGIEAWMGLSNQDMAIFEQNPCLCFVQTKHITSYIATFSL